MFGWSPQDILLVLRLFVTQHSTFPNLGRQIETHIRFRIRTIRHIYQYETTVFQTKSMIYIHVCITSDNSNLFQCCL